MVAPLDPFPLYKEQQGPPSLYYNLIEHVYPSYHDSSLVTTSLIIVITQISNKKMKQIVSQEPLDIYLTTSIPQVISSHYMKKAF